MSLKGFGKYIRNKLATHHSRMSAFLLSAIVSIQSMRLLRVVWDGEDWLHYWRNNFIAYPLPTAWAVRMLGRHVPFFILGYLPQPGDTVFDIGAGIGTELVAWSKYVGPKGRVIAIEADPLTFRRMNKLIKYLHLDNVTAVNVAVGETEGYVEFSQGSVEGQENRVIHGQNTPVEARKKKNILQVHQTTLSHICEAENIKRIDFLKMNIEGSEVRALHGLEKSGILPLHACICCHDFIGSPELRTKGAMVSWLQAHGYNILPLPEGWNRPSELDTLFARLTIGERENV